MAQDIFFAGIASPARLVGADQLAGMLPDIAFGWPYRLAAADPALNPFFTIDAVPDSKLFLCQNHHDPAAPTRKLDGLNALCDLFAALAFALPTADARLICLHAAAVSVGGQLLIFPNVRRAGKSTLSVALALAGHGLLGDDVVPLSFDAQGRAMAHGMGIAPRLRLPLPESAPPAFRAAVEAARGVRNRQYRYLRVDGQPGWEARVPVGAFVILDRRDEPVAARIAKVSPDQAMDVLLHQNFTRDRHSGDVLRRIAGLLGSRPAYRLSYSDLDDAVGCLAAEFPPGADGLPEAGAAQPFRLADFEAPRPPHALPAQGVRQRAGTEVQLIGETLYLADAEGLAIHRADPLAAAIWGLLSEPSTETELLAILSAAFPATPSGQIAGDLRVLLRSWAAKGLIETASAG